MPPTAETSLDVYVQRTESRVLTFSVLVSCCRWETEISNGTRMQKCLKKNVDLFNKNNKYVFPKHNLLLHDGKKFSKYSIHKVSQSKRQQCCLCFDCLPSFGAILVERKPYQITFGADRYKKFIFKPTYLSVKRCNFLLFQYITFFCESKT